MLMQSLKEELMEAQKMSRYPNNLTEQPTEQLTERLSLSKSRKLKKVLNLQKFRLRLKQSTSL